MVLRARVSVSALEGKTMLSVLADGGCRWNGWLCMPVEVGFS